MSLNSTYYNRGLKVVPLRASGHERKKTVQMVAGLALAAGTWLSPVTSANANDVQTITGSGTGTFVLNFNGNLTAPLSSTATAAQVQAALRALPNINGANITCTGGPLGSGTVVCTFGGTLGNQPQNIMVIQSQTGSSNCTIAHTTTGVANGKYKDYNGSLVTAPTTAATLTAGGSDGTFGAGSYEVCYTLVTAAGESTPSYGAMVTLTSAQHIGVTSITGLDNAVTAVNFYVNGFFVKQQAVSGNATGAVNLLTAAAAAAAVPPPTVNRAFKATDGSTVPVVFLESPIRTDETGAVYEGIGNSTGPQHGAARPEGASVWIGGGIFNFSDFNSSLDALGIAAVYGRFLTGSASVANSEFYIP